MRKPTFNPRRFAASILVVLISGFGAFGQIGYVDALADDAKSAYLQRLESVENDLANIKNDEWAGLYRSDLSNTMWEYLEWSPTAGFALGRETCSNGPRAWVNYGSVAFADGILRLSPERASESSNTLTLEAKDFRTVKWGQQHWLVPIDQLALFAWAVKSRSGAEYELFYIKSEDQDKPRRGLPDLPPQYKRMLTGPPIRAMVVRLSKPEDKWYPPMTINAGRKQGVIEGMYFWMLGGKGTSLQVYVSGVGERTSTVKVLSISLPGVAGREITLKPGLQLINRMPANYNLSGSTPARSPRSSRPSSSPTNESPRSSRCSTPRWIG